MKKYERPMISVVALQLTENIAAVPTSVYKGSTNPLKISSLDLALGDMAGNNLSYPTGDADLNTALGAIAD